MKSRDITFTFMFYFHATDLLNIAHHHLVAAKDTKFRSALENNLITNCPYNVRHCGILYGHIEREIQLALTSVRSQQLLIADGPFSAFPDQPSIL